MTVQRLSTNVSGKAQKHSRIGPREFVPYRKSDLTIEGIRSACADHFASKIDVDQMIDIVATEHGPLFSSLQQVPDLKLIHIRFVSKPASAIRDEEEFDFPCNQVKKRKAAFPINYGRLAEQ